MGDVGSGMRRIVRAFRRGCVRRMAAIASRTSAGPNSPAVVVAPHPDDEVFGAGGLIALKRAAGVRVDVVFLTNGEGAHVGCCGLSPEAIVAVRRRLAGAAGRELGLDEPAMHWLGLVDASVPRLGQGGFNAAAAKLATLLERLAPEEIYCPHPSDVRSDHVAACEITHAAIAQAAWGGRLSYYLVWVWHSLPLRGILALGWRRAARLDIRGVFEQKRRAIDTYLGEMAPGCGKPWSGLLPVSFLKAFDWPYEVFFDAAGMNGATADAGGFPVVS